MKGAETRQPVLDNLLYPIGVTCYFCCGEEFVGDTDITIVCRKAWTARITNTNPTPTHNDDFASAR